MSSFSPAIIGALVGLVFAVLDNAMIGYVVSKAQSSGKQVNTSALRLVGASAFIVFPVVGYFVGPLVFN